MTLCLAGFLMAAPQIFAENDTMVEEKSVNNNENLSETNQNNYSIKKELIKSVKETITPYREQIRQENRNKIKARANNSSLKVIIKEIVGEEEENRSAVIEFEGKEITVKKDQIVDGKFKVIDIYHDRMVVYSPEEQRRHTYKILDNNLVNNKDADFSKEKSELNTKMINPLQKPDQNNPIPPLKVIVKDIVRDGNKRYAIIEFEEKEIKVVNKQVVNDKFKVVGIFRDRLVVYSIEEQRRHAFKISAEKQ